MIEQNTNSSITTDATIANFSIEVNSSMFQMLTSKVYTDNIAAPIREWSTNAIDACLAVNTPIRFDAHIPTIEEPYFNVRDYGEGLSTEDILGLFSTLGASTKRNSNAYNGTFGIGRMSGLAYASSFSIESYHKGHYYSYLVSLQNGTPVTIHLQDSVSSEPSGLKLSLTVDPKDIQDFRSKATDVYKYFDDKPSLNIPLSLEYAKNAFIGPSWLCLQERYGNNKILMGNVAYRIPDDRRLNPQGFNGLVIKAPIGAVSINPGRESLAIDDSTIKFINTRIAEILDEYTTIANNTILNESTPLKQLTAYTTAFESAPYPIRETLQLPPLPADVQNIISSRYGGYYIINNSPFFNLRYSSGSYSKARTLANHHMSISNFLDAKIFLVDIPTGFGAVIKAYQGEHDCSALIISRPTGTKMPDFLINAKLFLASLGAEYILVSNHYVKPTATEKVQRLAEIYACPLYGNSLGASQKINLSEKYWYVPTFGTTAIMDNFEQAVIAYGLLPTPKPQVVGIPKKYLAATEAHTNFSLLTDHLQSELSKQTFTVLSSAYTNESFRNCHKNDSIPTKIPADLKRYLEELAQQRALIRKGYVGLHTINRIKDHYVLNTKTYSFTNTYKTLKDKYPLLTYMNTYNADSSQFKHYMNLEYQNEQANARPTA